MASTLEPRRGTVDGADRPAYGPPEASATGRREDSRSRVAAGRDAPDTRAGGAGAHAGQAPPEEHPDAARGAGWPIAPSPPHQFDAIASESAALAVRAPTGASQVGRSSAARGERPSLARVALTALVLGYLCLILVVPLVALAGKALQAGLGEVVRGLASPEALFGLRQSLLLAAIAVIVNGVFGVAGALVLVRQRFRGRWLLDALVDLPLAVSPVMTGLAFLLVFGRGGWLHPVLDAMGVSVAFSFTGLLLCTLFVTLPFTLREVAYVLEELGTQEEQCAATLGASAWQTFRRVTLPNVRHALVLGITLTAARALGEFGAVLVVGGAISGQTQTATTFIYAAMEERKPAAAYGMALLLAVASTALLLVLQRAKRHRAPTAATTPATPSSE